MMKTILRAAALMLLSGRLAGAADEIYVRMQEDVPAILGNGAEFTTEKGSCYPFVGYDATQALMQLKFGALSFWTRKENGEIVPEAETAAAAAKYGADVAKAQASDTVSGIPSTTLRSGGGPAPGEGTAAIVVKLLDFPLRMVVQEEVAKAIASQKGDRAVSAFPVDAASSAWQNCGVRVKAGQHVLVEAAQGETWNAGQGKTGAKGYDAAPADSGTPLFHTGTEGADWHWGALICAVGDSDTELDNPWHQVEIGSKREFKAKNDGYVRFICNGARELPNGANGYDNNSGIIHVKVAAADESGDSSASAEASQSPAGAVAPAGTPAAASGPTPPESGVQPFAGAGGETAFAVARQLLDPLREAIRHDLGDALGSHGIDHEPNSFPVDATSAAWQNSGVRVKAGQHVLVKAAEGDKWDMGWGPIDAKGYAYPRNAVSGTPTFHEGRPNDDWHWGSLICAVGDRRSQLDDPQHEVEVGSKRGFTVDTDGYLYFLANDNREAPDGANGYADNSGVIHVTVTVTDATDQPPVKAQASPSPSPGAPQADAGGQGKPAAPVSTPSQ